MTSLLWGRHGWRHQMETFSALLALCAGNSPVTSEFSLQKPVTRSFDVFFDLCLNKQLSKQSRRRWLEMPSCSLWSHCNPWVTACYAVSISVSWHHVTAETNDEIHFFTTLTHWGWEPMAAISQTTVSNAFSWTKIPIKIPLKFVLMGPINNIPALVQIMARHRPGYKPLSEPTMASLLKHICITQPQWVNGKGTKSVKMV